MDSTSKKNILNDCFDRCHRLIAEAEVIRAVKILDVSDDIELKKEISASI